MKIAGVTPVKQTIAQFSRNNQAASGDVSYSGLGFSPNAMFVIAYLPDTSAMSIAFVSGSTVLEVIDMSAGGNPSKYNAGGYFAYLMPSAGNAQTAILKSIDDDGFTLTWTKAGSPPAGTIYIDVCAFRF